MKKNRIKRYTALLLTLAMLLSGVGEQQWIFASSVSNESTASESSESQAEDETTTGNNAKENQTDSDETGNTPASGSQAADTGADTDTDGETDTDTVTNTEESDDTNAVMLFSDNSASTPVALDAGSDEGQESGTDLPIKSDGSLDTISSGKLYLISSYAGWKALAAYSKDHDLKGFRFRYNLRTEESSSFNSYELTSDNGFTSLGSEQYPFAGELSSNYTFGNIKLKLDQPLFSYLSSDAKVDNNTIEMSGSCSAGLADYLVVNEDAEKTYTNISISGTSTSNSGYVGGLFAHVLVTGGKTLTLKGSGVTVSPTITGQTTGGIIGELNGSLTIDFDGIDFSGSEINGINTNNSGEGCVGGIIGSVVGTSSDASTLTLTSSNSTGLAYSRTYEGKGNSEYCGGFFGHIRNMRVDVSCPMSYAGDSTLLTIGMKGYNAGAFAGGIDNSNVVLHNQIICKDVVVDRPSYKDKDGFTWEDHGAGLFAGTLKNSHVSVSSDFAPNGESTPALIIKNTIFFETTNDFKLNDGTYVANFLNCKADNNTNFKKYNMGFLAGLTCDSEVKFNVDHHCLIYSNKVDYAYGNAGGAIGRMVSSTKDCILEYVETSDKDQINLMNRGGNSGGLVGAAYISGNSNIRISNCQFNGRLRFADDDTADGYSAVGGIIGYVLSANDSVNGKLEMDQVSASYSTDYQQQNHLDAFGGVIGVMDANFTISNSCIKGETNNNNFKYGNKTTYLGGMIGVVNHDDTHCIRGQIIGGTDSNSVMSISIPFNSGKVTSAFGGILGYVGKGTAISMSNNISLDGQKINLTSKRYPTYAGSIVGYQNNALVYIEPEGKITYSSNYAFNEVGNYGGVIRNKNWDSDSEKTTDTNKLIQNFSVTGTLDNSIDSMGDLLRLAIALNTEGEFLPADVQLNEKDSSTSTLDTIRKASYTLSQSSYDLTKTGLPCLSRNDEQGISNSFHGSLIGQTGKTKIIYGFAGEVGSYNYSQPYSGLFSAIDGGSYENLDLQYYFTFSAQKFNSNGTSTKVPQKENVGGLAAIAEGNISVTNVSYSGKISDVPNSDWDVTEKRFRKYYEDTKKYEDKPDDYLGGLLGKYIGANDSSLTLNQVSYSNTDFTSQDFTHVLGGLIGYVDTDNVNPGTPCNISITGTKSEKVNFQGTIAANITQTTDGTLFPVRVSGGITQIGTTRGESFSSKCNLTMDYVDIDSITLSEGSISNDSSIGGILGWQWQDIDATISNMTVGATSAVTLSANTSFGGLLHTATGKITMNGLTMGTHIIMHGQSNTSNTDSCALLIQNGQYLYLNMLDYQVSSGIQLNDYSGYFDEIVGITKGNGEGDSSHGGIVSIGSTDNNKYYLGRNGDYTSYTGGHIVDSEGNPLTLKNPNTRYYYDLNKLTWPEISSLLTLNSPEAVMCWHLLHYANPYLRSCLNSAYAENFEMPTDYTIGTVDMTGYSIYPTAVTSETYTGGTITFNAKSIIEGEAKYEDTSGIPKYPNDVDYEHDQMHAGLFSDVSQITVDGLTIAGSVSVRNQTDVLTSSGALVSGTINGIPQKDASGNVITDTNGKVQYNETVINRFSNIKLNDLCAVSSDTINYENPVGLMIYNIASGAQCEFDGISMEGYTDEKVTKGKAASALIGNVGGPDATYISLNFKNMDIADAADEKNSSELNSSKSDEALAKASFIYSYNYAENCNGIYTFSYEDYLNGRCMTPNTKKVTLGLELGNKGGETNYALEEYFDWDIPVGQMKDGDTGITFDCNNYLPYVFTTEKKLLINPKTGHITEGCGTYEDPYIISTTRQLLTLYRYLYEEDKFKEIFIQGQWSINPTGTDDKICDKTADASGGHGSAVVYKETQDENFPTKAQLSQAYYEITADIDLSDYPEFTGFGTAEQPFVGVFIGKSSTPDSSVANNADTTYPVIKMPKIPSTSAMTNFGWIQNAKGCVVKDLVIRFTQPVSIDQTTTDEEANTIHEGGTAGGVIATILGGENIIDHVKVTGCCFAPQNTKAEIGGYVGRVNVGGLILRNLMTYQLSDFQVQLPEGANLSEYTNTCGVVGKVYDGYVVYDGGSDTETPLLKKVDGLSGFTGTSFVTDSENNTSSHTLEQSRSYDILNGAYLSNGNAGTITLSSTGFDNISNAKQLQVLSMALNAGLLNYDANTVDSVTYQFDGYNQASRQRSGDYSYVGKYVTDESGSNDAFNTARNNVIQYDNENGATPMQYHSYLSDWFNWSEMIASSNGLNPYNSVLTYTLTGTVYDMSVFGTAFRGLGARYFDEQYQMDGKTKMNVFHGNLMGPDSSATITLDMIVDASQDAEYAALLNDVVAPSASNWTISINNITVSGNVINSSKVIDETNTGDVKVLTDCSNTKDAAAIISNLSNTSLTMNNVLLSSVNVQSEGNAGGMVARCDGSSNGITFNNCGITGSDSAVSYVKGCGDTGGFIGYSAIEVTISPISQLEHMDVECIADEDAEVSKNAGGLIGTIEQGFTIEGNSTTSLVGNVITVRTTGDIINVKVGGLVGSAIVSGKIYSFSNLTLRNLTVENLFNTDNNQDKQCVNTSGESAGIIGTAGIIGAVSGTATFTNVTVGSVSEEDSVTIQNKCKVIPNHNFYITGGIVGRHVEGSTNLTMTNCSILGNLKDGSYTTKIYSSGSASGIIGNSRKFTGNNLKVSGVSIEVGKYGGGVTCYVEGSSLPFNLNGVEIEDTIIKSNVDLIASSRSSFDIGGLIGYNGANVTITDAVVNSLVIASDYCENAGGFIGKSNNKPVDIKSSTDEKVNSITNCFISGKNVGGVFGYLYGQNHRDNNITISNNKLISAREDTDITDGTAGGFAGKLSTTNSNVFVNNLDVENNLISAYASNNKNIASLGGVCGSITSKIGFYDVTLKDNAIGIMKVSSDEKNAGNDLPNTKDSRINCLSNTAIGSGDVSGLRDYVYFLMDSDKNGTCEFSTNKIKDYTGDNAIHETDFYQYSYLQGTFVGKVNINGDGDIPKFINVRVSYEEPIYRPVSDVGAAGNAKLGNNDAMYNINRSSSVIVYDGKKTEKETPAIDNSLLSGTELPGDFESNVPYVFANTESIMSEYTGRSVDSRMVYHLGDNYQNGSVIDREETNKNKSVEQVYINTYNHESSPFKTSDGTSIPMIVYRSSENGTLDEVLQTYINILTNNSGGILQDYLEEESVSTYKKVLSVKVSTYKMKLVKGVVSFDNNEDQPPSVHFTQDSSNSTYSFSASDGDDLTDEKNGTFSLIRIQYSWHYKENTTDDQFVSFTLDLPVYIEKRLKITTNMKMMEGIRYKTETLKTSGQHVLTSDVEKSLMILPEGSSYSVYAEFVYEDSDKFATVTIPKSISIETTGDIYFTPGTKMTLIPLDESGRAYYYEVPEEAATTKPKEINFTEFTSASKVNYSTYDIKQYEEQSDYEDLCGNKHEGTSRVERFVILVDTSESADVSDTGNKAYELHVKPSSTLKDNVALYSRTDTTEHCFGNVNEIPGASYKINTSKDSESASSNTCLKANSKVCEGGMVGVHLQYDIKADATYWKSVGTSDALFLDVGFSLAFQTNGGSLVKVPLPSGTTITLGTGDDKKTIPATGNQATAYYYQSLRQAGSTGMSSYIKINELKKDTSNSIDIGFDFSNADLSSLDAYTDGNFYVLAQLVVMGDKDLPAAGEIKDTWQASVDAELKSDFGFALQVDDLTTLGMNQYLPEDSDSGVVPYTASVAFPEKNTDNLQDKYYTILYRIEEKTSQDSSGEPVYQTYTGDDVSLYLGSFTDTTAAKNAAGSENSLTSGKGFAAVTYQFSADQIQAGADLTDGKNDANSTTDKTAGVVKTHCTLVANCENLNMTNYRVKAYLMVTDTAPSLTAEISGDSNGCLKGQLLRTENWPQISEELSTQDLKNDYFVFTVAKIKITM